MKREASGTSYTTLLAFLAWMLVSIILFFIVRKFYFKWIYKGKKENEKFTEEIKNWLKEKHDEHVKEGKEYYEYCEICKGLWN